jgi:hypothetical protein
VAGEECADNGIGNLPFELFEVNAAEIVVSAINLKRLSADADCAYCRRKIQQRVREELQRKWGWEWWLCQLSVFNFCDLLVQERLQLGLLCRCKPRHLLFVPLFRRHYHNSGMFL